MAAASPNSAATLEVIFSLEDVLHRHLVPFLTAADLGRLECSSKQFSWTTTIDPSWKILCARDFPQNNEPDSTLQCIAPVASDVPSSFDLLKEMENWKTAYQKWFFWKTWTCGMIPSAEMIQSIRMWARLKRWLEENDLTGITESLLPGMSQEHYRTVRRSTFSSEIPFPSTLLALGAVHAGQAGFEGNRIDHTFFRGILGSWSVYNTIYCMRMDRILRTVELRSNFGSSPVIIGSSVTHPPIQMVIQKPVNQKDWHRYRIQLEIALSDPIIVAKDTTILEYMETYVDRLEAGVFKPATIVPDLASIDTRGISLFPDANMPIDTRPLMSCAVTRGVQVKASARWTAGMVDETNGCNFAYSIRIQLVEAPDALTKCQLVGRHWEFVDGRGAVRRVDGEAVVGKQPLLFRNEDSSFGYTDLGPAGNGETRTNEVFVYQSQSGPVRGTSQSDTGQACVRGTFSFMPGSIDEPTGPLFHVTVAEFPLAIPMPFF